MTMFLAFNGFVAFPSKLSSCPLLFPTFMNKSPKSLRLEVCGGKLDLPPWYAAAIYWAF